MAKPSFFIIFSPEGLTPPVRVHESQSEAFGVANYMAKHHPGQTFYVMKSSSRPICKALPPATSVMEGAHAR